MKNAILLHGGFGSPEQYWFPSIKQLLISKGYEVWAPQLPDANKPVLAAWLDFVLRNGTFKSDTLVIGHSLGSALTLALLEKISSRINKAILVAGFAKKRKIEKIKIETMLKDSYDWQTIKRNAKDLIFINSSNDP